jgi:hypothetical protein
MTDLPGEIRFVQTNHPASQETVGVVGWVPEEGEPAALRLVRAGRPADRDYAMASSRADALDRLVGQAVRVVAKGIPVADTAGRLAERIHADWKERGHLSEYAGLLADEPGLPKLARSIAPALRSSLDDDAFRTLRRLCSRLQVEGGMDLLRIVEPLCGTVREASRRPEALAEAAKGIEAALLKSRQGIALDVGIWRRGVEAEAPAAPAP